MTEKAASGRNFGYAVAGVGLLLLVATLVTFVVPLPDKLDTALVIAWLFAPGVVGGLVYARMERNHSFDEQRHLD